MKNIIKTYNFNTIDEKLRGLNLEELGIMYYFQLNDSQLEFDLLLKELNLEIESFKALLQKLNEKEIIKVNIDVKDGTTVYWEISYNKKVEKQENLINNSYLEVFYLSSAQTLALNNIGDERDRFLRLFNLYNTNIHLYKPKEILIENVEQYEENLRNSNPLSFLWSLGIKPDVKEVYTIYEAVCLKEVKKEVVNFLIDYTVSTSIYKNFAVNFFNKVLENWMNNEINTLDIAMKYVKEKKAAKHSKNNSYVDPSWEEIENNVTLTKDEEKLKEIEEMIKGNK